MSDAIVIERPPAGLNAAGYWFGAYGLILERGAPWQQVFEPAFWVHAAAKLRAGDQIEVHTADHEIAFVLYVKKVNHRVLPVLVEFAARAIFPPDLQFPASPVADGPTHRVQRVPGGVAWEVRDASGVLVGDNLNYTTALDRAASLDMAAPPDQPGPGAQKTRRYRERQSAAATAMAE